LRFPRFTPSQILRGAHLVTSERWKYSLCATTTLEEESKQTESPLPW
jgi:hypothetical protein